MSSRIVTVTDSHWPDRGSSPASAPQLRDQCFEPVSTTCLPEIDDEVDRAPGSRARCLARLLGRERCAAARVWQTVTSGFISKPMMLR